MDSVESYLIALISTGICGFFAGGAKKHLELQRNNEIDSTNSPVTTLYVLFCGLVAFVYGVLWALAVNHNLLVMIPFLMIWFGFGLIGDKVYGPPEKWKLSLYGLIWIPVTYHLGVSYIVQKFPVNF
ncbi:hypothetical protein [Colwellia echini]|uniref:Uncharacterized protein n=1 Tax=Colwellia echini TaxID=1982103 RepID=A0ABY3MSK4_9GAMM|nr:hypothetical protein [Colwellia echini]TYK64173.1 hypothetical protein CWS31_017070 [Colwellia echini]